MARALLRIFLLLSLLNLYGEYSRSEALILVTKPLLLTVLSLWFYLHLRPLRGRFPRFILAGLIFSIGGDVLLMLVENGPKDERYFLLGLGSFLLAQLSYLSGFLQFPEAKQGQVAREPWRAWPFALFLAAIIIILWPGIPAPMKAPVAVYAFAIVSMGVAAFNLKPFLEPRVFVGLMSGILLFLLSDSLIALDKFRADAVSIPYARLFIMATYLLGQYWIARHAALAWKGETAG
ncbi:MAG: lysoplasmalogenase [Phaeodactylibacter sp.]|nr:lysoplasmalogenase [Phaeodactylibacter sp.]